MHHTKTQVLWPIEASNDLDHVILPSRRVVKGENRAKGDWVVQNSEASTN